ncbi:cell division protein FtsL [Kingella sp. SNUBH-2017]|jgi:cell division protein ftsL|uniref:Cell division protein FtsL n=1 Tax=Kingella pumchi TaxID=2779506 RepID=A0ABS9NJN2_9NEIS|nr:MULTISPECIES: cell division protein FtsL [Kingella]MCG6502989.1 cell division protein FtsL [Kingella pumchi]MDD2183271.1 cell division protein FtsL [Kingella sp. SNUBH-2017]
MNRLNILLLVATVASALWTVELQSHIRQQIYLVGKGREEEIRLKNEYADLQYNYSHDVDTQVVGETAARMKMRLPRADETIKVND